MIPAPLPPDEKERLEALRACDVLDTDPELPFDDLTELAARICGTPIALVSLVDAHRQWFKSRHGLDATETPRDLAFCAHAILQPGPLVVPDASADERFHDNPLVTGAPHVRAYAGVPLVDPDGHALGTMCVIDHAPRQFTPEVLDALQRLGRQAVAQLQLRRSRDAAVQAAEAKSRFLANMSHEIRTPLNGVIGLTGLLLDTELAPPQREMVATVRDCGEHLLALVDDILDFSKLEAGKVALESVPFDLQALAERALAMVESQASAKGLALRLRWQVSGGAQRVGDPTRLRQVLLNLLVNAVKFTRAGEVTLTVAGTAESLVLRVTDTGIGIARDDLARIFDRFSQADASTTRQFGGTGLGLAISRRLVELMGGSLRVESAVGQGSTFSFHVPLRTAPAEALAPAPAPAAGACTGLRVLLAEDNAVNRFLATHLLGKLGCEVIVAEDGRQAVEAAMRQPFDLVLMDCQMPVMDGYEATARIRALEGAIAAVPIIALTASALAEDRERCLFAGMSDFLSKPIVPEELHLALQRVAAAARESVAPPAAAAGLAAATA
jgi:signal transduction histidine kinase/ActR/RegA family two-component response regulator